MQNKKKVGGRTSGEIASAKGSRHQKKVSENLHVQVKKVSDIITSSTRKQKTGRTLLKNIEDPVAAANLDAKFEVVNDETSNLRMDDNENNSTVINIKDYNDTVVDQMVDTIFSSPAFHIRSLGGNVTDGDFLKIFKHEDPHFEDHGKENLQVDFLSAHMPEKNFTEESLGLTNLTCPDLGSTLSSEISAVYLSMKNQKLECADEYNQAELPASVCYDDEEVEEFDDFDPYFFMKNLPDLYSVVPLFRPVLLPKQTRSCPSTTLVLDLDETLVHSTLEPCDDADFTFSVNFNQKEHTVYVRCRPHLRDFMDRVSGVFEIIIFTASQSIYAEQLLNVLDPKRKVFRHRVFRESCVIVDGNYLKDLSVLGRDLAHVIIVDNSPQVFRSNSCFVYT
ncbi:OLC1v1028651C3 [Oldenlandia corymbosa var. corymbosa]|uniref:OLC1v1028651C3 n=1 Tax=Oldenlandia corymbosa var. corymbosa TaxID=529605 RepID=A0AAV1CF25_OLDCO|nr:OLC1v1028651C3 [Oldenlandia corymbosa var. corymbosa]